MRYELTLMNDGTVAIRDTFNTRELVFAPNNDRAIRDAIRTFYNLDHKDMVDAGILEESDRKEYVDAMMDELPQEDLSFKEVKENE